MALLQLTHLSESQQLGQCIAAIYHHSQGTPLSEFKQHCFQEINKIIALKKGLWLVENTAQHDFIEGHYLLQMHPAHSEPEPNTETTQSLLNALVHTGEQLTPFNDNLLGWQHGLAAHLRLQDSGITHGFIFQPAQESKLSKDDLDTLNSILPHLAEAFRLNILSRFDRGQQVPTYCRAVSDSNGHLIEAEASFNQIMTQIDANWNQQTLPFLPQEKTAFFVYDKAAFQLTRTLDTFYLDALWLGDAFNALTVKEKQVCFLMAGTLSNQAIADKMAISRKTVENHLTNIYAKLGNLSRAELFSQLSKML